ncbi:MAG: hypothetical protein ACQCN4_02845 [Candidatus Bathyarchaeia archaeon]|jgi:hypothetical protein
MNVKKSWKEQIRGWVPNEYWIALAQKVSKPYWWKPLWVISALGIALSALALLLVGLPLDRVILGSVFASICLGIAYYIRVRPSLKINRIVYICLGIGIGWVVWVIYALSGAGLIVFEAIGAPALIVNFLFYIAGAVLGDQIGKKRSYMLPLSL